MNDLIIRDARPDERAAIRALTLAAYQEHAAVMAPTAWAGLRGAIESGLAATTAEQLVAERDGVLLGSVMLFPPAPGTYGDVDVGGTAPELRLLAVAPAARSHGVGRALVQACMERARRSGATALGLHSSDSLRVAVRMYERMGFVRAPEEDFQPESAELVKGYRIDLGSA